MPNTTKVGDGMFEDALYRHSHDNIVNISIVRSLDTMKISITFTISSNVRKQYIKDTQVIPNKDLQFYSLENITFRANEYASKIDSVPDYIPDEQSKNWIERKINR